MEPLAEIKKLYRTTTPATVARDLARAITLLKTIEREEDRERAAVYMEGLAELRAEWGAAKPTPAKPQTPRGQRSPKGPEARRR